MPMPMPPIDIEDAAADEVAAAAMAEVALEAMVMSEAIALEGMVVIESMSMSSDTQRQILYPGMVDWQLW